MTKKRYITIGGAVLLLVLGSLACSISGSVDVEGPLVTPQADEEETAASTEAPAEATDTPQPTEATEPPPVAPAEIEEPPVADTPAPTEPPPAEQPPAEPPPEPPADQEPLEVAEIPELEVTSLDPQGEGLGHLGTFRQRMRVSFTAEGSDYTGVYNYDAEVNTADQAVHLTVSAEGAAAMELPANTVEAIWIGTQIWVKVGNQPWLPVPEGVEALPFDEQVFAAGNFLPYVQYFQRVDERVVNGINCAYYTYDAQNLPTQYGAVSGSGDICVALDGGYVVRYTLDGSGTFAESFQGSGTLQLAYDTYDVGADIVIRPPRGR
jgi:hypothetical protein